MKLYWNWSENNIPAHFSVGAVLFDKQTKAICCHHFLTIPQRWGVNLAPLEELYLLARETPERGESMEDTIKRGLMEEFGAEGNILEYLGSIKSHFNSSNKEIEKTTTYFLVEKTDFNPEQRDQSDPEKESSIEWQSIDFLIGKMKHQQEQLKSRTDLDESSILEIAKDYINNF